MPARRTRGVTVAQVVSAAKKLPGVEESVSYRTRALKVKGKLIARFKDDERTLVLRSSFEDRAHLMAANPKAFFLEDHYHDHPFVLIRIAALPGTMLPELLEDAWRRVAPPTLLKAKDTTT